MNKGNDFKECKISENVAVYIDEFQYTKYILKKVISYKTLIIKFQKV